MAAVPPWLWAVLLIIGGVGLVLCGYYSKFRRMCRKTRDELSEFVAKRHPSLRVLREDMGNLVVRFEDGSERVWELSDLYVAVARLPGMGQDSLGRAKLYDQALAGFLTGSGPGDAAMTEPIRRLRPQLVPISALPSDASQPQPIHRKLEDLGLAIIYVLPDQFGVRTLTRSDLAELGIPEGAVHLQALENLRQEFPGEMVSEALCGSGGTAVQMGDSFDAARLLLVPEHLAPDDELIALVPHRDLMLLLPPKTADDPNRLLGGLAQATCDHPPLLRRAVRVTCEGFHLV